MKNFKNGPFWCLCKIGHSSELRGRLEPRFAPECCPIIALQAHTYNKTMQFPSRCFRCPRVRFFFRRFFLGPSYEELPKMADFGVFSKLDIARSYQHFWSRGLHQNVVRWLHFKRILIKRRWDLRRGVLGAREFDLLFGRFSLGPPYEEFQKWPILVSLQNWT